MNLSSVSRIRFFLIVLIVLTIVLTAGFIMIHSSLPFIGSIMILGTGTTESGFSNLKTTKIITSAEESTNLKSTSNKLFLKTTAELYLTTSKPTLTSSFKRNTTTTQPKNLLTSRTSSPQISQNFIVKNVQPKYNLEFFHNISGMSQNHSLRNSQLKPFQIQVTIQERQMMYTLLKIFDETMKSHNITYFMYGGTLLGSFRHHDLIPWDDDLDVLVPLIYHKNMTNIFQYLSPNYTLYRAGGHDKFYSETSKKASEYNWKWPYLDISFYEENNTHIKDWIETYGHWYIFPKEIVFPLHNRPLFNLALPAPKDTFAFLVYTYNYGSPCKMFGYSHMVEGRGPYGSADCESLTDTFPFVDHLPHENGVREILKFKDVEITNIIVPEPSYAVAETFKLALKPGYTVPSNLKLPK